MFFFDKGRWFHGAPLGAAGATHRICGSLQFLMVRGMAGDRNANVSYLRFFSR
jgi:hypothetical protein